MKSKSFSGEGADAIIKAVNDWLAGETGVIIRDTRTEPAAPDPKTGVPAMTFSVWYDQDGKTP